MEDDKTLRDIMTEKAMDLLEKTESIDPGTEKHSRIIEDVVKLSKACNEDYKAECEMYHDEIKIEYDKERGEKEVEVKKLQVDLEELKSKRNHNQLVKRPGNGCCQHDYEGCCKSHTGCLFSIVCHTNKWTDCEVLDKYNIINKCRFYKKLYCFHY